MISKDNKQLVNHYFLMITVSYKDYKKPIKIYDFRDFFTLAKRIIIAFDEVIVSSFYENLE